MEQNKNDRLSELFNTAKNETPKVSVEETQQQFLKTVSGSASFAGSNTISKLLTAKSIITSVIVISILAISGVFLFSEEVEISQAENQEITETNSFITEEKNKEQPTKDVFNENEKITTLSEKKQVEKPIVEEVVNPSKQLAKPLNNNKRDNGIPIHKLEKDTAYRFPVLSVKEIKANNKQKLTMLKYLARWKRMPAHSNIDTRKYPRVYWHKTVVDGKRASIDATDAFYMQNTEVSVLEYRTFLFDLLIQNRKDDFLIAKPDQEMWNKEFKTAHNQPMVDTYFSHPAYNDYPINNISRKGAEMYCEWLTEERNKLDPEKYGYLANPVRLPTAKEWVQAASRGHKDYKYPWGNEEKILDTCYLANYQPVKGNYIADGGFHTVKVNSYNLNGGMYCMSGNVAEMVTYEDGSIGAKGGSWTSLPNEIEINAIDKYKGVSTPSVNIGFRPVITYLATYSPELNTDGGCAMFPLLTYKEIQENNTRKIRMFGKIKTPKTTKSRKPSKKKEEGNAVKGREEWYQPDPFGYLFIPMGSMLMDNEDYSIQAFYMKQTEVSNIEYRTFLLDLLINNRRDEFLLAKPDQRVWNNVIGDSNNVEKVANYFADKKYDDYPAVGVSREGAEMYCKWLNEEYAKRNVGTVMNNFRIPTAVEWSYAASGGGKRSPYPWGGPYVRNSNGAFLANFHPMKDDYSVDGALYTATVTSYNPNDWGLYCMSGNVAEMVINKEGKPGTKGGSFTSVGQELQIIEGKDRFEGVVEPNVNIGFRPVMTYLGHSKYKTTFIPPGTVKVDDSTYIDETEISNFMWVEYLYWQEKTYGLASNEYKNALPDTLVWKNGISYNEPYVAYYLRHSAYRNYPVVGISYEQAVAYCRWRTERVKELYAIKRKEDKKTFYHLDFEYRLPTKEEWENAANVGYSEKLIKKLGNKAQFNLMSNLNDTIKKHDVNSIDVTAPVHSYYPNKLGCYNLIGNVAEMTSEKDIAKGGSWIHQEKEVTVEKDFEYTTPERWLGFRCVYKVLK